MRVIRGRAPTIEEDRAVSGRLLAFAADGRPAVRVWRPHPQVAFGRRDTRADGYQRAREIARNRGFPPVERDVGGRAVAYTGSTVAFARATPTAGGGPGDRDAGRTGFGDARGGIDDRYDAVTEDLRRALTTLGVDATQGEPDDSFCPGTHSLRAAGKLVGIAQRVRRSAAITAGILLVADHEPIAGVLEPVYDALGTSLDPDSVGSMARAGGVADPDRVVRVVESGLLGETDPDVSRATDVDVEL